MLLRQIVRIPLGYNALLKMHFYELNFFLGHRGLQDKYNIGLLTVNI